MQSASQKEHGKKNAFALRQAIHPLFFQTDSA